MIADDAYAQGHRCRAAGDLDGARQAFQLAAQLEPGDDAIWAELGRVIADQGNPEVALAYLDRAVKLNPRNHHALCVYGAVLSVVGRNRQAIKALSDCLAMAPHMPAGHWNRAGVNLAAGNYQQGFADYEYGFCNGKRIPRLPVPMWDGKARGRVLFWGEQGAGDIMMFVRFIRQANPEYAIFETRPDMLRLMEASGVADRVVVAIGDGVTNEEFDHHCPILSLPTILGLEQGDISGKPYLFRPFGKHYILEGSPKVGLVHKGNPAYPNDHKRSIHNEAFLEPIRNHPGIALYNYQKDTPDSVTNDCFDWGDTADALSALDVLVTTDTGIAHLAGAMGVRTMLMIPYASDWRWGDCENPSPRSIWYDSVDIYRQPRPRDWRSVVNAVVASL